MRHLHVHTHILANQDLSLHFHTPSKIYSMFQVFNKPYCPHSNTMNGVSALKNGLLLRNCLISRATAIRQVYNYTPLINILSIPVEDQPVLLKNE